MITSKQKYGNAVRCAIERGIEWQFTYDSWMEWWGDDFHLRGPKSQDLCMARHGDMGPYHPSNVSKKTNAENIKEMRERCPHPMLGKKQSLEAKIKIAAKLTGKKHSTAVNASKGRTGARGSYSEAHCRAISAGRKKQLILDKEI